MLLIAAVMASGCTGSSNGNPTATPISHLPSMVAVNSGQIENMLAMYANSSGMGNVTDVYKIGPLDANITQYTFNASGERYVANVSTSTSGQPSVTDVYKVDW